MSITYADGAVTVYGEDCLAVLRRMPDASVDAVVTDPPYGLADHHPRVIESALRAWLSGDREHVPGGKGFMGRSWDRFVPPPAVWDECARVLKPGGHLLAFAAPRTADLMTMSIRLAGFEIRDSIEWIYAQGMPKSHNVSAGIDKAAGAERQVIGTGRAGASSMERSRRVAVGYRPNLTNVTPGAYPITAPATDAAVMWSGWGTALKPAHEVVVVARNAPTGSIAENVVRYGTGALNVNGCRIPGRERTAYGLATATRSQGATYGAPSASADFDASVGRWPTNVVLSHVGVPIYSFPADPIPPAWADYFTYWYTADACADGCIDGCPVAELNAQSDASRFFPTFRFEAKATTGERPRGSNGEQHVSVKPIGLMRWLVRLVTQPGGLVVDPFGGTATTAEACLIEGFRCVVMENDPANLPLIDARLRKPMQAALDVFGGAA